MGAKWEQDPKSRTRIEKSGNKNPKLGTTMRRQKSKAGQEWEQSGNKNPQVGQEWDKVETEWEQEPTKGTRREKLGRE